MTNSIDHQTPSNDHHYYAVWGLGWVTADTYDHALRKLLEAFGDEVPKNYDPEIWVFRVELPQSATYEIRAFVPVVDKGVLSYSGMMTFKDAARYLADAVEE